MGLEGNISLRYMYMYISTASNLTLIDMFFTFVYVVTSVV